MSEALKLHELIKIVNKKFHDTRLMDRISFTGTEVYSILYYLQEMQDEIDS